MASRHDIVQIDFRANAGRANPAIESLRTAAKASRDEITRLNQELANKTAAGAARAELQKLGAQISKEEKKLKQFTQAERELVKGVGTLAQAIEAFNNGSLNRMSAAFQKASYNAAELQKKKLNPDSSSYKKDLAELNALQQRNLELLAKAKLQTDQLVATIRNGGAVSKTELTQEAAGLRELMALIPQGTKEWQRYNAQLSAIEAKTRSLTAEEQRMAGQRTLGQAFRGDFATASVQTLEQVIAKLKEYRTVIDDPNGKGARHFQATTAQIQKLSEQLARTKGDIVSVQQAMKVAGAAGTANRFGSGLDEHSNRVTASYKRMTETLNQLQQARAKEAASIIVDDQRLAQLDAQIASTTARQQKLREEMVRSGEAVNLNTKSVSQSIQVLRQQQETVAVGSPKWQQYEAAIASLENRMKIMRGEAMSLRDAMKLSGRAGGQGFTGTAQQLQLAEQAIQKAANAAKKGSPEWTRYQEALAKVRVEMQNAGMTSERMRSILDKPANAKNLNELQAAVKRAKAELDLMAGTVGKNSKEYAQLAKQTKQAEFQLKEMQAQAKGTAGAFEKAWSRLKTYMGLYVSAAVAMQKVVATMGDLMELSDKMGEVRKTTGFTADEVGRLSENLKRMDTRTTLVDLLGIASEAGTLGLKTQQDIQGFTEAANMLMVSLPEMGQEAAKQLMKIANATGDLKKNGGDVEETMQRVGSTIIALRANSASAAPEIADFASRVGAVGAQAGISIDQIVALGSTIDALGGRVEMSATALSRMIPAIRNNAFGVANAIGVTEKTLKDLFDQGRAMEAMVLIFRKMRESVQQFDTSTEEGTEAMAKNVEDLLGKNAAMADVMKELNQQGARAGIVFGLLSQNVDELERQLGIAGDAYKQNTALLNEYNNMNETTAAKWARLKNQLEEFFVGDDAQRWLGRIVDGLRWVIDLMTGSNGWSKAIRTVTTAWAVFKLGIGEAFWKYIILNIAAVGKGLLHLGTTMKAVRTSWIASWKAMDAATKANWIGAIIAGLYMAGKAIYDFATKVSELDKTLNDLETEEQEAEHALNRLVTSLTKSNKEFETAKKKHDELTQRTETLRKEVDELKQSNNLSAEATETLKQKEDELKRTKEELKQATDEMNKANGERLDLIKQINDKYSTYLGYMLNEATAAEQVASAHQLIISALKEEMAQKRLLRTQEAVEKEFDEDIQEWRQDSRDELDSGALKGHKNVQQQVMEQWESVMARISYDTKTGLFTVPVIDGINATALTAKTVEELRPALQTMLSNTMTKVAQDNKMWRDLYFGKAGTDTDLAKTGWGGNYGSANPDDGFGRWTEATLLREQKIQEQRSLDVAAVNGAHQQTVKDAVADIDSNFAAITKITTDNQTLTQDNIRMLAQHANAITAHLQKYSDEITDVEKYVGKGNDVSLTNAVNTLFSSLDENTRKQILTVAQKASRTSTTTTNVTTTTPYGQYNPVTSPYSDWNADDLVKRRKEMLERVRTLAAGADVQAVLSEDAAFITKATRDNIKTTQQAIEWYNTERLKIQEALHEKHLTNTGDWMDPSKAKGRQKTIKDEWSAYLNELDAYYTERKAMIQEAQNDGEISEAEAWRRTLQNDAEWHQRRAELQKLYADKAGEVTQEEQNAIFAIIGERTGDTADFIQKTIGKTVKFIYDIGNKSEAEQRTIFGKLDKGIEQDFLRQRNAIGKQMKAIQDIIDKERPFNGLAENLRENMVKMDALMTDVAEGERTRAEETKRMMFLLQEAENAYALTTEQLLADMRQRGFGAWADALAGDDSLQRALLVQLHQTYDAVQDAIKKEASLIKKQAENVWSSILMPDGVTPLKQAMEQSITTLGLQKDSVSRANSLIGAGQASERVADRLAIKQMQVQLAMQKAYYDLVHKTGLQRIADLKAAAKRAEDLGNTEEAARLTLDAQHATMSLNLATTKEQTELDKQRVAIANQLEESQNRLYKELREWGDLIASSLQSVFEASNTGQADFYNEIAKLRLTGDTGGGTYVVIDNAGTSDATAHYETYATEEEHLRRQLEIDQQNAVAEAWKKVMDDINQKMNDMITDQINAMLQNSATDANTEALGVNTQALYALAGALKGQAGSGGADMGVGADGVPNALRRPEEGSEYEMPKAPWQMTEDDIEKGQENMTTMWQSYTEQGTEAMMQMAENLQEYPGITPPWQMNEESMQAGIDNMNAAYQAQKDASDDATNHVLQNQQKMQQSETQTDKKMASSSKSMYAAMTAAANLYGVAYQAMQNDNLDMAQKFEMIALQAVGNAAIAALNVAISNMTAKTAANEAETLSKDTAEHGSILGPILFAVSSALIGGLVGLATSKITKSKAQIAQVTGASSASAGRLSTGMLTYAEGNVNEFTDPATLTPGRQYNVDAADGRTYRARYMGSNPRTHLTNGPEFHLSGERGREMIIDAGTTRQITMNEGEIWHAIQTLSGGGSLRALRSQNRRRGIRAFADGNVEDFSEFSDYSDYSENSDFGMSMEQAAALQASIDRQSDLLADLRANGIKAHFDVYGKGGLIDSYDTGKKTVNRHGERY